MGKSMHTQQYRAFVLHQMSFTYQNSALVFVCLYKMYMLGANRGFTPTSDCTAQSSDFSFACKSEDCANKPRIVMRKPWIQPAKITIFAIECYSTMLRTRVKYSRYLCSPRGAKPYYLVNLSQLPSDLCARQTSDSSSSSTKRQGKER